MLRLLTKEEEKKHAKELRDFCKENHCEMYNIMINIKNLIHKVSSQQKSKEVNKNAKKR